MPLFGYTCKSCGQQCEVLVRADEKVVCPSCGSAKMERQMSRFAPVSSATTEPACSGCALGNDSCCASGRNMCCMS